MIGPGTVICNQWTVVERLGSGGQGTVYKAVDKSGNEVAVKTCPLETGQDLYYEFITYCIIDGNRAPQDPIIIPRPHTCITLTGEKVLVMEILGSSVQVYHGDFINTMPIPVLVNIFKRSLTCLEYLHDIGIIHRDIKPENICIGKDHDDTDLRLIDLGLSCTCEDNDCTGGSGTDLDKETDEFVGTIQYCSLRQHFGKAAAKIDDLESLCFSMMYLYNGSLPWLSNRHLTTMKETIEWIVARKQKSVDHICAAYPKLFNLFLRYVRNLPPNIRPDYGYLHRVLDESFPKP